MKAPILLAKKKNRLKNKHRLNEESELAPDGKAAASDTGKNHAGNGRERLKRK